MYTSRLINGTDFHPEVRTIQTVHVHRNKSSKSYIECIRSVKVKVTPWNVYAGTDERRRYISNPFANSAQAGDGQSEQRPGHFTLGKDAVYTEKFRELDTGGWNNMTLLLCRRFVYTVKKKLSIKKKPILTEGTAITCSTAAVHFQVEGIIAGHWNPILYYELFNVRY
jgi:hypothetical protein